jgi:hypothetical protein
MGLIAPWTDLMDVSSVRKIDCPERVSCAKSGSPGAKRCFQSTAKPSPST